MAEKYMTLTPAFRQQIMDSIGKQLRELDTCEQNALVAAQRLGLTALDSLIRVLPDGYPVPVKRNY